MRVIIAGIFVTLCATSLTKGDIVTLTGSLDTLNVESGTCPEFSKVTEQYRAALDNFTIEIFKHAAPRGQYHYVVSPHNMWITIAGIAEGADPFNQKQLFQLLNLPNDPCHRQKYYQLARTRFSSTADVNVDSTRALVIDEGVTPNPKWHNYVTKHSLLEVVSAPIKHNAAAAANRIRQVASASFRKLNLQGNSVLLDTIDYNGLWTTAFADAVVKRAPFYSPSGRNIGAVDLMRTKRRGRIGYVSTLQAKLLELPVGANGQYRIIISLAGGDTDLRPVVANLNASIITEVLAALKDTNTMIDVALPQFTLSSELDVKAILEDLGVKSLWTDPEATRYL